VLHHGWGEGFLLDGGPMWRADPRPPRLKPWSTLPSVCLAVDSLDAKLVDYWCESSGGGDRLPRAFLWGEHVA
jgi:hypothetical protein